MVRRGSSRTEPFFRTDFVNLVMTMELVLMHIQLDSLLGSFLEHLQRPGPEESQIRSVIHYMDGKKPLAYAESAFLNDWSDLTRPRQYTEKGGLEIFLGMCAGWPKIYKVGSIFLE